MAIAPNPPVILPPVVAGTHAGAVLPDAFGVGHTAAGVHRSFAVTDAGGQVYNVKASPFNATGDGVTDDTAAIQLALNTCGAAGGGTVYFPPGIYRMATTSTQSGFVWILTFSYDNVTVAGAGDASVLWNDAGGVAALGIIGGATKAARAAGNVNDWFDYMAFVGSGPPTIYSLTGTVAQGTTTVTLASAGDAANVAIGDYIAIRTGQTNNVSAVGQPDAEINKIKGISGATLTLQWPTKKAYVQEYYVSGTSGRTTTLVTANLAPFGIQKLTDRILANLTFRNFKVQSGANRHAFLGGQFDGMTVQDVNGLFTGGQSLFSTGTYRDFTWERSRLHHTTLSGNSYIGGPDSGSSDVTLRTIHSTADQGTPLIHIQEGASNVLCDDITTECPEVAADHNFVSIRGRAYNVRVLNSLFVGGGNTAHVFADEHCVGGGLIDNITVRNSQTASQAVNIRGNLAVGRIISDRPIRLTAADFDNMPGLLSGFSLGTWVADNHQTMPMGRLRENSYVKAVHVQVTEAFNSDGTDELTVGYTVDPDAFATTVDVSTTGIKTVTLGSLAGYNATARDVVAYYVNGGSEPTTGKVLVLLEYVQGPAQIG